MTASVPPALVLEQLLAELPAVAQYAAAAGLDLDTSSVDEQHGAFYVTL